jgi:peroxiredoxin
MALVESNMIPLGTIAPDFSLPNVVDNSVGSLSNLKGGKGTLVVFICNHCPYVVHLLDAFVALAKKNKVKGLATIAISSNDVENYPADHPDLMRKLAQEKKIMFPYLYDEAQTVAKAYDAACTPDFYLLNAQHALVYHGRFDASRPGNDTPITGEDLQNAIDAMLKKDPIPENQYPSMGCNIKWKTGNEPAGFSI